MDLRLHTRAPSNYRRDMKSVQQELTGRTPMTLVRRVARPMLAAMFVVGGLDQLKHPGRKADTARPLVEKVAPVSQLPDDPELMVGQRRRDGRGPDAVGAGSSFPDSRRRVLAATCADHLCGPRVLARAGPRGRAQAEGPVPQEPRPARRPAPRRRRHRKAGRGWPTAPSSSTAGAPPRPARPAARRGTRPTPPPVRPS